MSDITLYDRKGSHPNALTTTRTIFERSPRPRLVTLPATNSRTLSDLPFDILLLISECLDPEDIVTLQRVRLSPDHLQVSLELTSNIKVCRTLRDFAVSRHIWLQHATHILDLCKPLPINAFERVWELDVTTLSRLVRRATRLQHTWMHEQPGLRLPVRVLSAPQNEDIVWLSPITSRYTLCCTKAGNVLCWDVTLGECVASWHSGVDWEIWKCRVEFEERTVYFAMAKKVEMGHGTDCQLMALTFPEEKPGLPPGKPEYKKLCFFCFPGHVISVYLLNPLKRLLSAYIWIPSTNTLGLYLLLDWTVPVYVYINTGISCDPPIREWSCIGYDPENIVIHAEEEKGGLQFFYPYSFLQNYATRIPPTMSQPKLVPPPRTVDYPFIKNKHPFEDYQVQSSHFVRQWWPTLPHIHNIRRRSCTIVLLTMRVPEGLQALPDAPPPGVHLFTIAQHYFSIPLQREQLRWWYVREPFEIVCVPHVTIGEDIGDLEDELELVQGPIAEENENMGALANLLQAADGLVNNVANYLYGGNVNEEIDALNENGAAADDEAYVHVHAHEHEHGDADPADDLDELSASVHIIPLIAVDFGCAVWLEYVAFGSDEKRLRFVTFPPVDVDRGAHNFDCLSASGAVRTLDVPPEIDLGKVCHVGIDQAQGSVILGLSMNQVYIMRYD